MGLSPMPSSGVGLRVQPERVQAPMKTETVCYSCSPPYDWSTPRALKEHKDKTGHP